MSLHNKKTTPPPNSKEAKATRLKQLRALTAVTPHKQLSRATLERKYGISASTLRHWEEGYGTGLTESGAKQVIDVYQQEGIHCSIAWLLTGTGKPPVKIQAQENISDITPKNPKESINKECDLFKSLYDEAIITTLKDDSMSPIFLSGDTLGGIRHYHPFLTDCIGLDCIIETKTNDILVRRLQKSTSPTRYNLYALNPNTKLERPFLYDVEIITCAPITRIWREGKNKP